MYNYEVARKATDVRFYNGDTIIDGVKYSRTGVRGNSGNMGDIERVWFYAVMGGFPIIVTTDDDGRIDEFIFWDVHGGEGWLRTGRESVNVESVFGDKVTFGSNAKD
jgi:hypothetical protein